MNFAQLSLSPRRLSEEVAAVLRKTILDGSLAPGTRLIESEIATRLGVSKSPLREALRVLLYEGLVVNTPRRGSFVANFSEADFQEISSIRGVLEGFAAELVAQRQDPRDLAVLQRIVEEMLHSPDTNTLSRVHLDFHRTLIELTGHSRLIEIWHKMEWQIRVFLAFTQIFYQDRKSVGEEHWPIIAAIREGRPEQAKLLLKRQADPHLQALRQMRDFKHVRYFDDEPREPA